MFTSFPNLNLIVVFRLCVWYVHIIYVYVFDFFLYIVHIGFLC